MGFEERAQGWLAWARTSGHDAYWTYRDAFFDLVPAPGAATLEVGCGEGRVARDLVARGHRVTGLDASPTLLRAAAEAYPASDYVVGPAEALPFEDGAFDLVVAYNSLMDVADMPAGARGERACSRPAGGCARASPIPCPTPDRGDTNVRSRELPRAALVQRHDAAQGPRVHLAMGSLAACSPLEPIPRGPRALEDAGLIRGHAAAADPGGRALGARRRCSSRGGRNLKARWARPVGPVGDPHVDVVVVVDEWHHDRAGAAQGRWGRRRS
jgi:SAM-dependent methyltransferase